MAAIEPVSKTKQLVKILLSSAVKSFAWVMDRMVEGMVPCDLKPQQQDTGSEMGDPGGIPPVDQAVNGYSLSRHA